MSHPESASAQAERHVREGEKRLAYQDAVLEGCEIAGDDKAAGAAREMLALVRPSLEMARVRLLIEIAWLENDPRR